MSKHKNYDLLVPRLAGVLTTFRTTLHTTLATSTAILITRLTAILASAAYSDTTDLRITTFSRSSIATLYNFEDFFLSQNLIFFSFSIILLLEIILHVKVAINHVNAKTFNTSQHLLYIFNHVFHCIASSCFAPVCQRRDRRTLVHNDTFQNFHKL